MLSISKTFEIITEESAEHGDAEERGFEWESVPHTFRELVKELRDLTGAEGAELSTTGTVTSDTWITGYNTRQGRDYFERGETTNHALHFDRSNHPRKEKYWIKALRAAGHLKGK